MCFESLSKFQLYIGWRGLMCQVSKSFGSRFRDRELGELSKLGGGGGRGLRMAFWELLIREKTWSEDGSNLHHGASSRGQSLNLCLKSYNPSSHLPPNKPFLSNTNTPWIFMCIVVSDDSAASCTLRKILSRVDVLLLGGKARDWAAFCPVVGQMLGFISPPTVVSKE